MNTAKRYDLNDIILKIIEDMQPISHQEIWFEMGESFDAHSIPSQEEIDLHLEEMEKKKILKKIMFPDGREKYLLSA